MPTLLIALAALAAAGAVLLWPGPRLWPRPRRSKGTAGGGGGVRQRVPTSWDPALVADLVAAALGAGVAPSAAVMAVASAVARVDRDKGSNDLVSDLRRLAAAIGSGDLQLAVTAPSLTPLREALAFAVSTGTPAAEPLRHAAHEIRRAREAAGARAANRLAARLVLPLGLAALPGFLLLGIAPVVLHLLSTPPL